MEKRRTSAAKSNHSVPVMPIDEEHGRMMDYARSGQGRAKIAKAQAEVDAGLSVVADDAYFVSLNQRISGQVAKRRAAKA